VRNVVEAPAAVAVTTTLEVPVGVEGAGGMPPPQLEMTEIASRNEKNAAIRMGDLRFVEANATAVRETYNNDVVIESQDDAVDKMNRRECTLKIPGRAIAVECPTVEMVMTGVTTLRFKV
jgi:hypothetical protein